MSAESKPLRLGILASHPIQYQAPIFRALAQRCALEVFFAHRQPPQAQAEAGFGVAFEWDVDLLSGYEHQFLRNVARRPGTDHFLGCDTPEVGPAIGKSRFDAFVVMGWNLKCYWQAVRACRAQRVPVLVRGDSQLGSPRAWPVRLAKRAVYPWLLRRFDGWLYVGQRNREYLLHYGADPTRLFFAPHSIDVARFQAQAGRSDRAAVRAGWGVAPSDRVALFSGKLLARKRPADLVTAAALLRGRGLALTLVWAGDGPERAALDAQAAALGVPMRFLGFQNQSALPAVYRAADALVLPSDATETWGLVVNEALACGTPCVVSDACGCAPDLARPGAGAAFRVADAAALADALAATLARPTEPAALQALCSTYSPEGTAAGMMEAAQRLSHRLLEQGMPS